MAKPELRQRLEMLDPIEMAAKYVPQMRQEGASGFEDHGDLST